MKRHDISRLQKNRSSYFKLGLIVSLSLVIYAFNWTTSPPVFENYEIDEEPYFETEIIRTADQKKPIPPPEKVESIENFIEEDTPEFIEEPIEDKKAITEKKSHPKEPYTNNFEKIATPVERPEEIEIKAPPFFKIVEEMPRFSGCVEEGLSKEEKKNCAVKMLYSFMAQNLKYPAMARENNIAGTVIIRFIVEKDGSISNTEIVRNIGGGCGREALRVVKAMPNWLPGKQRGRPVRVQFNLPVKFQLN